MIDQIAIRVNKEGQGKDIVDWLIDHGVKNVDGYAGEAEVKDADVGSYLAVLGGVISVVSRQDIDHYTLSVIEPVEFREYPKYMMVSDGTYEPHKRLVLAYHNGVYIGLSKYSATGKPVPIAWKYATDIEETSIKSKDR